MVADTIRKPAVPTAPIGRTREIGWSVGSVATGAVTNAMSLFALFFMTSQLGLEAGLAGLLILATKLYDAVSDPVMGRISDNWQGSSGRRSPFLLWGAGLLGLSILLFFSLPPMDGIWVVPLVFLLLILLNTGYTIYAVPYLALPPDLATGYDQRTRLMSYRVFFLMIGVLVGAVLGPRLVDVGGGYRLMAIVIGSIVILSGAAAYFSVRRFDASLPVPPRSSESLGQMLSEGARQFVAVFKTRPFALLTIVKLLQLIVLAMVLASFPYFFSFVLEKSPTELGAYMGLFSLSGIIAIPLIRLFIKAAGKRNAYIVCLALYALGLISWYFWTPSEAIALFYARAVLIGIVSTGTLFCALAMLPDTMEYDRLLSGQSREGTISGVFTFVEKLSSGLGPVIVGFLLQATGLIATQDSSVVQPEAALEAIHLSASLIPAAITLLCIPVLLKYRLDADALAQAREVVR